MTNITVYIEGMMCNNCKRHVEDALKKLGLDAEVSLENKNAKILNTDINDEIITKAIEDAGYDVMEIKYE